MSTVAIIKQPSYENISTNFRRLMHLLRIDKITEPHIIIKINMCGIRGPETGAITHPLFLNELLRFLREDLSYQNEIFVVETNATSSLPDLYVDWFGFADILQKWRAKFVNLTFAPGSNKIKDGVLKGQIIPDVYTGGYFISLSKLKTHMHTKITCSLKNQFGCIPYPRKARYHNSLDEAIVEANKYYNPDLSIVDGIIALTGVQGPGYGIPVKAGVVIASTDPVACDSLCAKLLGFNPLFVKHIQIAKKHGLGRTKYKLIGDTDYAKFDAHWGIFESSVIKFGWRIMNRSRKKAKEWY